MSVKRSTYWLERILKGFQMDKPQVLIIFTNAMNLTTHLPVVKIRGKQPSAGRYFKCKCSVKTYI